MGPRGPPQGPGPRPSDLTYIKRILIRRPFLLQVLPFAKLSVKVTVINNKKNTLPELIYVVLNYTIRIESIDNETCEDLLF